MKIGLLITGGVAASIMPGWILYLRSELGWEVTTVISKSAGEFVTPAALEAISGNSVYFGDDWVGRGQPIHKTFSDNIDVIAVCPASYNICGKLGAGVADDIVSTFAAFSSAPVVIFPAFSESDVGRRRELVLSRLTEMGYIVSENLFSAFEVATGSSKEGQGFPTIFEFVRIIEEVESSVPKTSSS